MIDDCDHATRVVVMGLVSHDVAVRIVAVCVVAVRNVALRIVIM